MQIHETSQSPCLQSYQREENVEEANLVPGPHALEILELATTSTLLGAECGIYCASLLSTFGCALPL
jgi:hypothetical protein